MHFEVLLEDQSGKRALEILMPKIIDNNAHTIKIHAHKGIGHIPKYIDIDSNHSPSFNDFKAQLEQLAGV